MRLDINAAQANFRNNTTSEYDRELEQEIQRQRDEYVIQAVANLGQRLGVKGDSIKTSSFTFRDLFTQNGAIGSTFTSSSHIGKIERRYGSMYISIVPKSTLRYANGTNGAVELNVMNSGDVVVSASAIDNPIKKINGVDFYKSSSVIAVRTAEYVFCGVGCEVGNNGVQRPVEFVYEEYDKSTHTITSGLRLRQINGYNVLVTYQEGIDRITIDTYELSSTDESFLAALDSAQNMLKDMNGYEYNSSSKTYENRGVTNETRVRQMSLKYWLNFFKISSYGTSHLNAYRIKDSSDTVDSILLADFQGDSGRMGNRYNVHELQNVLEWFKYDQAELFKDLKEIYSQQMYASSNDDFRQQILCAIFNGVYDSYPTKAVMYVPIDFRFNYYCNSNDQWKIYGSVSDINVRFVNVSISPSNLNTYYSNDQLIANIAGDNRSALYDYNVEYDDTNPDIVYTINVQKKYTMPYINSDDVWVINNQVTNIVAKGKDAGNPNIIIVYNYNKSGDDSSEYKPYKVLASADYQKVNKLKWKTKTARVQPIDRINVDDPQIVTKSDLYNIACRVPDVQNSNLTDAEIEDILCLLKYSVIFNISSVQCFEKIPSDVLERYGEYGVVTSLWTFNERTLDYDVIEHPGFEGNVSNVAFDLTAMSNLNNLVKWHIMNTEYKHPDRYSHRWLVFDNANVELKNNSLDYRTYIYPVIMNKPTGDFNAADYNNELNFIVKYNDAVTGAEDEMVTSISQTNAKYLTSDNIRVTNSMYYRKIGNHILNYKEYVPNYNIPVFHMSEVLQKDTNVLNRVNIITPNSTGDMYYTYVGMSFDEADKNTVHIGGATTNINLGDETMVTNSSRNLFKRPTKLSIDFEDNYINGYVYVSKDLDVTHDSKVHHINWEVHKTPSATVYRTNFIPDSKYLFQQSEKGLNMPYSSPIQFNNYNKIKFQGATDKETMITGQLRRYNLMSAVYKTTSNQDDYKLWVPAFYIFDKKYIKNINGVYIGDLLYLPGLLCRLHLFSFINNLSNVKVTSNMDIVRYQGVPLFFITTNKFVKNIEYSKTNDGNIATYDIDNNMTFVGNMLSISYYTQDNILYITVDEVHSKPCVGNLYKIKLEY